MKHNTYTPRRGYSFTDEEVLLHYAEHKSWLSSTRVRSRPWIERPDAIRDLGWRAWQFYPATRKARLVKVLQGNLEQFVCLPSGNKGQPWWHFITHDPDEIREWALRRVGAIDSQMDLVCAMHDAAVYNSDLATPEGRKNWIIARHMKRVIEDLTELEREAG